jgi:hypothetical protein
MLSCILRFINNPITESRNFDNFVLVEKLPRLSTTLNLYVEVTALPRTNRLPQRQPIVLFVILHLDKKNFGKHQVNAYIALQAGNVRQLPTLTHKGTV